MDDLNSRQDINKYRKFKKVDGATYRRVNQFLRKRTYITAREWALARLCTDFRTSGGAEMTFIGMHLPELVPFMEDTYTPQAVNQARNAFKKKVRKSSATFFYGAMCGFFTTDELDDLLFEASEVARFLLEVEGTTLDIDEEIDIEDRITRVMRGVGEAAKTLLKNRGNEGTPQERSESTNPSAAGSECEMPPQGQPGTPDVGGTPDTMAATGTPDQTRLASVSAGTAGPAAETGIHDGPPAPGEEQISPTSGEKQRDDDPEHTSGIKNQETIKNRPAHSGNSAPEGGDA
ncbi:MAG: DUF5806 family protein [Methanoregula sp.]|nr:DUF5806 family protein [Methanoregula sp.]